MYQNSGMSDKNIDSADLMSQISGMSDKNIDSADLMCQNSGIFLGNVINITKFDENHENQ